MARRSDHYDYGYLRRLIEQSLESCPRFGACVDGKIRHIPEGLWHDNFRFWTKGPNQSGEHAEQGYILRLVQQRYHWQEGPEPRERLLYEGKTLEALRQTGFPHPTPEFVCFVADGPSEVIGMIETAVPGICLDEYRDRSTLRAIARAATSVHQTAVAQFGHLPGAADRASHVRARLDELDQALFAQFPSAEEVRQWILGHLPSGGDACLLHGDLLPQNLIWNWEGATRDEAMAGIIDWEMARIGDPAYDLAIVSRGNRKVCRVNEGANVLLEEYLALGGTPIALTEIRVHELLLILGWLEEAWREHQKRIPGARNPDQFENQLRSLHRRAAT